MAPQADHADEPAIPRGAKLRLFRCPTCGVEEYRWRAYRPMTPEEAEEMRHTKGYEVPLPVYCRRFECGIAEMDQVLSGIGMDVLPEGFTVDGQTIGREAGEVRISSLSELRQIERDSEQKFRNGEGQIVAFREFSQDRGNRTRNVFTDTSYETGRSRKIEKPKTQSNLPISVRATKS